MDDIIVRVMRTVACVPRLRILSHLTRGGEEAPTALAEELDMPLDLLCTHLRRLSMAGLILRRPSGVWCYYRAESPYSDQAFSGKIASWLRRAQSNPARTMKKVAPEDVRGLSADELEAQLHETIFDAATAFTHARRLQILRRLAGAEKGADAPTLMEELHMSKPAVSRHMDKLTRRGYACAQRAGRRLVYGLASAFRTRLHEELLGIVRNEWQK